MKNLYHTNRRHLRKSIEPRFLGLRLNQWISIVLLLLILVAVLNVLLWIEAQRPVKLVDPRPLTVNVYTEDRDIKVEVKTPEQQEIADFIRATFGKDADKAFQVLSCENASLNPDAVNTAGNFPAGSRDIGVFQVNSYWQDVNPKFLFDYKINVMIAKKIFDDSGRSFKMWSCGKRLGI